MSENEQDKFKEDEATIHYMAELAYLSILRENDGNNLSHGELLRLVVARVEKSCKSLPWFIRINGKFRETLGNLIDHKIQALNDITD